MAIADLKVEVTESGPCKKRIAITVGAPEVKSEREKVIADIRKNTALDGFRKGKVPKAVIVGRFSEDIKSEVLHHLTENAFRQALEDNKIEPISQPMVDKLDMADDDTLTFEAEVEVAPDAPVDKYTGFDFEKKVRKITDKHIDDTLDDLRERNADFEPKEGAAEKGDFLLADVVVIDEDGNEDTENARKGQLIMAGHEDANALFSHKLVGISEGDDQRVEVDFPDDYQEESVRGKKITYKIDVKGVKVKKLPEADDEFAKSALQMDSIDEVKKLIRENLDREATMVADRELEKVIFDKLIEENPFELPENLVNEFIQREMQQVRQRYQGQQMDEAQLEESVRPRVEYSVRRDYILGRIAEAEEVEATEDDIKLKMAEYAAQMGQNMESVQQDFARPEAMSRLRTMVLEDKVVRILQEKNNIKEVDLTDEGEE